MTEDQQLKLQAFLDGELPEAEMMEVAAWIARDADARAMHAELKNTRHALKTAEPNLRLPESREFFWSKIEREVQKLEPVRESIPEISVLERIRRWLMPLSAAAVLVIAGLLTYQHEFGSTRPGHPVEEEMAMADSNNFTYHDYSSGMTLVWLPFPAEKDLAQAGATATIQ